MDQTQDQLDPEVAREVIALLNKKITNLRSENAQLQGQLSGASVKSEDGVHGVSTDHAQRLSEEIEHLRSELERRPDPEEVSVLEKKFEKSKQRRQESERELRLLSAKLEESESGRRTAVAVKEALEKEIENLCHMLNERTREKEEAISRLEAPADQFDFRGFLDGRLVKLPSRPKPALMTAEEKRRFKDLVIRRGEEFFSANVPNGIIWADECGGCIVPLPSVLYNGKTQINELLRDTPVANRSYEFCGVDERNHRRTYHGTYRCIEVIKTDWEQLKSLDPGFAERFLGRVVVEIGFAPPVFVSFVQQLYKTGALRVDCVVLLCERFDSATVREARGAERPPTVINVPSFHNSGKRPNEQQNRERAKGSSKKPRLKN